ncbi:uncharacterized protein N7477_005639 [Penicillium maclennaniae]|uniref:uncharacterized protein n=1 Tax=Penicillium maclennaniae TaxID=1343394 RepID=UPI002541BBB7|nr:uncharacterized protein N7477_005639 [Penicillium maclennaniae]KAJ5670276.1 hypothetical protein N7477_005639 [Penicillium maclennaniae]
MIHTSNLTTTQGTLHPPLPGQPEDETSVSMGRPVARKSQIIEEEEDDEEIEEVDDFDGPEDTGPEVPEKDTAVPVLEPAPQLETGPILPPRSSSLRSPPSKADVLISAVTGSPEPNPEVISAIEHADEAPEPATTK